jgi:hypothetical protein
LTVPSTFSIILQLPIIYLLCNLPDGADFTGEKRDNPCFFRFFKNGEAIIFYRCLLKIGGGKDWQTEFFILSYSGYQGIVDMAGVINRKINRKNPH